LELSPEIREGQRPTVWAAAARSLTLHLVLVGVALALPVAWEAHVVRLPVAQEILLDLKAPAPPRGERLIAVEAAMPRQARRHRASRGLHEETVSLDNPGRHKDYLELIKQKLEQGWEPEAGAGAGRLMLLFSVERSGRLSRVVLLKSSGHPRLDSSALAAVRRSGPFDPMPSGMDLSRLNVRASFRYRLASS
jgi:TonB family protein